MTGARSFGARPIFMTIDVIYEMQLQVESIILPHHVKRGRVSYFLPEPPQSGHFPEPPQT